MIHTYIKGSSPHTIILLHGTGGDENDLLSIGSILNPNSTLLGIRGNVLENGMSRYFKRVAEGIFDEQDLVFRTKELKEFIDVAIEKYQLDRQKIVIVGYSNGANIAASMIFHYGAIFQGAILYHPMVPIRGKMIPQLAGMPVLIGAGKNDPICSITETEELAKLLKEAGAELTVHWENHGHQLSEPEVHFSIKWYNCYIL
ncbi:phospholipase/carboxylesterase [Seinonella peptonophila]|uniref:Phospholipase/carboxylesterase n=1 Tax=Seinonella peptonophila TaxID=112248 RepID=A0A1M4SPK8_9BACL|nr:alpha/beta hydrolase [Seinonella peptonophila]SHE34183.1 phospholipase/carboxylesterase [Seinonella peptonophila]